MADQVNVHLLFSYYHYLSARSPEYNILTAIPILQAIRSDIHPTYMPATCLDSMRQQGNLNIILSCSVFRCLSAEPFQLYWVCKCSDISCPSRSYTPTCTPELLKRMSLTATMDGIRQPTHLCLVEPRSTCQSIMMCCDIFSGLIRQHPRIPNIQIRKYRELNPVSVYRSRQTS
jgi:hypothetical protein